jgi:NAD(P)H-dependent FMN reductase
VHVTSKLQVLLLCGSSRAGSTNEAALRTVARLAPEGVEVSFFPGMMELPLFNPDDDVEPLHQGVMILRAAIAQADALLISTPEYAGDLPGAFKNLLDWTVGGVEIGEKPTGWINVSSAGPHGSHHTYESLRRVLGFTGAAVIDDACVRIPVRRDALGPDGLVRDPEVSGQLASAFDKFLKLVSARITESS